MLAAACVFSITATFLTELHNREANENIYNFENLKNSNFPVFKIGKWNFKMPILAYLFI